jgi:LPS sulfotransferase NodH
MRLPQPFVRLPLEFDVQRLREEVSALPASAWADHPNRIPGNSSVRLISARGGENDDVDGAMLATPHLENMPYVRQVLASFGVVWGRSRLMRLAPGANVPPHADINCHWYSRVRLHIPVITRPEVRFRCDDQEVHMQAGEAWLFDNWRLHSVVNPTPDMRIHLVADTSGSSAFWRFVHACIAGTGPAPTRHRYQPERIARPLTENSVLVPVMVPAEVELLVNDLLAEVMPLDATSGAEQRLLQYRNVLSGFAQDWRQLYLLHGESETGKRELARLRDSARAVSQKIGDGLVMRTNRVPAHTVFEARLLRSVLREGAVQEVTSNAARLRARLDRPVFIVAAPRSGSTLLFETLAQSSGVMTVGGEAHFMVEGIAQLQPGAPGVDSNRLTAEHYRDEYGDSMRRYIDERLQDRAGRSVSDASLRFLEKTPKNALRVPFLNRAFPDALFIFLWRDPRENLSSIIEAWRSGNWKTYNGLSGFDGPWSLLLPRGWQEMNGKPLEEIAAFQWNAANQTLLDDLAALPQQRWTSLSYGELLANPLATVTRLCEFAAIPLDQSLRERVQAPLPHSKQTHTAPAAEKWRSNEAQIARVLPTVAATWKRLQSLRPEDQSPKR